MDDSDTEYKKSLHRLHYLDDGFSTYLRLRWGGPVLAFVLLASFFAVLIPALPAPPPPSVMAALVILAILCFVTTILALLVVTIDLFLPTRQSFLPSLWPTLHFVIPAVLFSVIILPRVIAASQGIIWRPSGLVEYLMKVLLLYFAFGIGYVCLHKPSRHTLAAFAKSFRIYLRKVRRLWKLKRALKRKKVVSSVALPAVIASGFLPPATGLALKLKRSQTRKWAGTLIFALDVRMDVSQQFRDLIYKYSLGNELVYDSAARRYYQEAVQQHLTESYNPTSVFAPGSQQAKSIARTYWKLGRAAVSSLRASLALRVTIGSLLSGVHIESQSLSEILEAEGAIRGAAEHLKSYIDTAETFNGTEEVIEL